MRLCRHNHAMTPDNTGTVMQTSNAGRQYLQTFCKQCRRDAAKRYAATHKRPSRAKKKPKLDRFKPKAEPRLRCRKGCGATAETEAGIWEHEWRFHEPRFGA